MIEQTIFICVQYVNKYIYFKGNKYLYVSFVIEWDYQQQAE